MRPYHRMNLFRELLSTPSTVSSKTLSLSSFASLSKSHLAAGVAILVFFLISILFLKNRQERTQWLVQVTQLEGELKQLESEIERKRTLASLPDSTGVTAKSEWSSTWTELVWKTTVRMPRGISLQSMEWMGTEQNGVPVRNLVLIGQSQSLQVLKDWLSGMIRDVPGYAFSMDEQTTKDNKLWPINFRITAKASS